jgi:radical SAM superfamily enzyme YgiQ (UPF0313 family)
VNVLLISTYDLGHQPFGLSSPQAWLAREGHAVRCADLAVSPLDEAAVRAADLVAFHLPMHTATRLAVPVIERVKRVNPRARLACYGLYAPLNQALLRELGVEACIGGEYEPALAALASGRPLPASNLERLRFVTPVRDGLPGLKSYAHLRRNGHAEAAGYTEASRGCKHRCRHCPVVPVYNGRFRVVQREVVLADIRQQVTAGARHITFGDPDFFNGPAHALRIAEALHAEFPELTYDATIKIQHLKQHRDLLKPLRETGCLFVTSAVESVDDAVLAKLEKNHTRRDFYEVAGWMREAGLALHPTFIAFLPWTTPDSYGDLLGSVAELGLIEHTAPVQLALRLLITQGSRLLELEEVRALAGPFDAKALVYPWKHPDPRVDQLARRVFALVGRAGDRPRAETFAEVWQIAWGEPLPDKLRPAHRVDVPHLDEPWYCCAEPAPQV